MVYSSGVDIIHQLNMILLTVFPQSRAATPTFSDGIIVHGFSDWILMSFE